MKKLAILFAFLLPLQSLANICPVLNSTEPGLADGCTTNPAGDGVGDYGYIFPYVSIFKSTFTGACNNHDKCYATLGADYAACDQNFYSDMRSACMSKFNPLLRPAEYSTCMHTADLYYAGVSAWRADHPEESVGHQRNALWRSRDLGGRIDREECGTTPERATLYTSGVMSEVRAAFQSYAGRQPTIYEFMLAVNWGDNVHNYVDDRSAWRTALYTAATEAASRPVPPVSWYVSQPGDYEHLFSVTPVLSNATYKWHIPNWGDGPTLRLGYSPPMFNRTVTYAGFVRVTQGGVRNMALVETKLVLPGTCAPNNGPYVNCL